MIKVASEAESVVIKAALVNSSSNKNANTTDHSDFNYTIITNQN